MQMVHHAARRSPFGTHLVVRMGLRQRIYAIRPAAAQHVVELAVLPDARVINLMRPAEFVVVDIGDDRLARNRFPVEQQRIARHGHHQPRLALVPVVGGNHPVRFDKTRPRKAVLLGVGIDRIGQVTPVHQVAADGMPPVHPPLVRIALVEQVPVALPETQAIWVVKPILRCAEVIERPVAVLRLGGAGGGEALEQDVSLQLLLLGGGVGAEMLAGSAGFQSGGSGGWGRWCGGGSVC